VAVGITKTFNGKEYIHDKDGVFTEKSTAEAHADWLKRNYSFVKSTKVENRGDGVYFVWWSYK
jgi:hypothetical protein